MVRWMASALLALIMVPHCAYGNGGGEGGVEGVVLDARDGQPLPGVAVYTDEAHGTVTDAEGRFRLEGLSPGGQELVLRSLGYATRRMPLEIPAGGVLRLEPLRLATAANRLDAITVNANRLLYDNRLAGANTLISPRLLRAVQPVGTEEILRTVPGLNVVGDMGVSNRPNVSIRGSWGRRSKKVLLLEDGSYIAPAPYIAPGAYYNPPADRVEAIQVIKGAETLLYGPNNAYGVVNYITRRPPAEPEIGLRFSGGQRGWFMGQASYGGTWDQLGSDVQVLYKRFDGFTQNSGVELFNLHTKFYFELDERQSFYLKLGYQRERNNASLAGITPFTFRVDPTRNPFDADVFTSRRYGLDLLHTYAAPSGWKLTSKVYGADFARDWWRQKTAVVAAEDVRAYVGEEIWRDRYAWMEGVETGPEDLVRVGRVVNGREATTDSRWNYTFAGWQEDVSRAWSAGRLEGDFKAGARLHREVFLDRFVENDSSRWARSGRTTLDLRYDLTSVAAWARQRLALGRFSVTPILRYEYVDMVRKDLLAAGNNPNLGQDGGVGLSNAYGVWLPGLAADARLLGADDGSARNALTLFASTYQGFIAPSKVFGFLVERDGVVTPAAPEDAIVNMRPELSWNNELGLRGTFAGGILALQMAVFHNDVRHLYAGGRNEVFEVLGGMRIRGLEWGSDVDLARWAGWEHHGLGLHLSATVLDSRVTAGELFDRDLIGSVLHSTASRDELLDRVNTDPGVTAYVLDAGGNRVPFPGTVTAADLPALAGIGYAFGEGAITDARVPYTPPASLHARLSWEHRGWSLGLEGHYVAAQYTEFANFEAESADGALGRLPAFFTWDAQAGYRFRDRGGNDWELFCVGKNLGNDVYRSSRLNRATSGIFPGGFRQVHGGVALRF